jgi:uncharacterized membrane protein YcfT
VKLTRRVPWPLIWLIGAALEIAPINTGWTVIDEFASRFVYFYSGYIFASLICEFAAWVQQRPRMALLGLAAWAVVNGLLVVGGYADRPFVSLALGIVGAGAVVAVAALLARSDLFQPLRYCGENSIVIYLAFFLPMAATRIALLKTGIITDLGTISLIVTAAGVIGAMCWYWAVRSTRFRFLFARPAWAQLRPRRTPVMQPAE